MVKNVSLALKITILFSIFSVSQAAPYGTYPKDYYSVAGNNCVGQHGLYNGDNLLDTSPQNIESLSIEVLSEIAPQKCAEFAKKNKLGFTCNEKSRSIITASGITIHFNCAYSESAIETNRKKIEAAKKDALEKEIASKKMIDELFKKLTAIRKNFLECAKKNDQSAKNKFQNEVKGQWFSSLRTWYFENNFNEYTKVDPSCSQESVQNVKMDQDNINNMIKNCQEALAKCTASLKTLTPSSLTFGIEADDSSRTSTKKSSSSLKLSNDKKANGASR